MKALALIIFLVYAVLAIFPPLNRSISLQLDGDLIEQTCKHTPFYDLCVSSLKSDPRSSTADVKGLGLIMVDKIKAKASETLNRIKKLQKPSGSCADKYKAILNGDVPQAIAALTEGDYKLAEEAANDAAIEAESCEKDFAAGKSPLTESNKLMHDLSVVTASIVRILL